jgi:protein-S-isoprenylcysteine O-methyltransferase Ste14
MAISTSPGHAIGNALVAVQLALIAALAWLAAPAFLGGRAPLAVWLLVAAGAALGLWALSANRPGNFNVRPMPRAGGRLVQHGPYRWIRHPMYTAVIACAVACAWADGTRWGWLGAAALTAVLAIKAALEERWMVQEHPGYREYRARTSRFLPGLL